MRGQPVARAAGGGAGPLAVPGPRAGGDARRHALPRHRPADLPAHAAAVWFLLVCVERGRPAAFLARGCSRANGRSNHPGAPEQRWPLGTHRVRPPRADHRSPADLPRAPALVRLERRPHRARERGLCVADRPGRQQRGGVPLRGRGDPAGPRRVLPAAGGAAVGPREHRRHAATDARPVHGARAPGQPRGRGHRRLCGGSLRARRGQGHARRHRGADPARRDPLPARARAGRRHAGGPARAMDVGRAVEQLAVVRQQRRAQAGAPRGGWHPPRSRDDALPDQPRLHALRAASGRGCAHRRRRHAAYADAAAGLHPQSGRWLGLDARLPEPPDRRRDALRRRRWRVRRGHGRLFDHGRHAGPPPGRAARRAGPAHRRGRLLA
ncbi:hypothetical protein D3C81_1157940 [compost metagenome]